MRYANGKRNKAMVGALAFLVYAALDVLATSIAAAIFHLNPAMVRPSWMLGPVVFNPVSVPLALATAAGLYGLGKHMQKLKGVGKKAKRRGGGVV